MSPRPLCFVLMPSEPEPGGVDFDAVYDDVIAPAIDDAGFDAVRADTSVGGDTARLDQMLLCDLAVADLTTAGAGVYYDLGGREAVRPYSTVAVCAAGSELPIEVDALEYVVDGRGRPADGAATRQALRDRLAAAWAAGNDRPAVELVDGFVSPDIARLKTDVFRERVPYSPDVKRRLAGARHEGVSAVQTVEAGLGEVEAAGTAELIDLLLSYRSLGTHEGWQAMVDLVERMSAPLAATAMVQEQLGLALNRLRRREEAEQVLVDLIGKRGASSETCSILGRVYKDQWSDAVDDGDEAAARRYLDQAIGAYLQGFEADWRDAFPGVNAVTLMELREPPDSRRLELIPIVRYATCRRIATGTADYWDYATLVELDVLGRDATAARDALARALDAVREPWEPQSTADNLALIRKAREARGDADPWAEEIEDALRAHSG